MLQYKYGLTIPRGWCCRMRSLHETAELLEVTQRCSDDFTLASAQFARGVVLVAHDDAMTAALVHQLVWVDGSLMLLG